MTVEEPKTTDAESAANTPDGTGEESQAETATTEAAATDVAPVESVPAEAPEAGATAAAVEAEAPAPPAEAAEEPAAAQADVADDAVAATPEAPTDEQPAPAEASAAAEPEAPAAATVGADPEAPAATETPATAEAPTSESETAAAEPAADEPAEAVGAEAAADPAAEAQAEPTEPEAAAEPEAAPEPVVEEAPVVDDRPEPTTMAELLAEQPGDIPSLKHGDVVEGKIVRIDKDEMLVDVGAKSEGVVSNRELYGRNAESQPELAVGDTVLVYVLQPESTDGHAVLSLRRAGLERKWRSMQEQFDEGEIIEAPVIDHNKGGLIVDCGIRGFVPISQIVDFPRRPQNDQPRDAAQEIAEKLQPYVGRKLRLKILEVNRKANRLILSEKVALYEERREKRDELFSSLETGQKVKGTVRSIAPFGIFVDLGGIDGLVHKSELSWNKVNNPEGAYEVGDEVEAEVIDINHERGRISLSIRRLLPDPWASTVADLNVGDITEGTVTKIVNFGAFVRVKDGLEGLIHISELSHQRVAHPGDVVHEGQTLKLKIISLDSERHRLGLSLKQAEEAPERPARERRPRSQGPGFDRSQAVQEPEGGIDNTLAAAFAEVRQQIAEQDAADSGAVEATAQAVEAEAIAEAVEAEAVVEAADAVEAAAVAEEAVDLEKAAEAEAVAEAAEAVKQEAEAEVIEAVKAAVEAETPAEEAAALEKAEEAEAVAEAAEAIESEAIAEEIVDLTKAAEAEAVAEAAESVKAEAESELAAAVETAVDAEIVAEAAAEAKAEAEAIIDEAKADETQPESDDKSS